jgi:magnesium transporter
MITIIHEEEGKYVHSQDASLLPALLADKERCFWLDLEAPSQEELALLSSVFHFHPLAIEDAANANQRPKIDEYDGYAFLDADEVALNLDALRRGLTREQGESEALHARQVGIFLGDNYLVTVHREPVKVVQSVRERCRTDQSKLQKGPDVIMYMVLDALVDNYFPMLDAISDWIDDLEDRLVARLSPNMLDTIFATKGVMTRLRRYVGPLREVLQSLTTRDFPGVQEHSRPYFRDVSDHLFHIYETLDSYRDVTSNLLDAYLSQVNNEMNRSMQRLASVGTVFLPLTFITSFFGMNFTHSPWLNTSVWVWIALMLGMAMMTFQWLRKRHWV